jgi:hypothetical protein
MKKFFIVLSSFLYIQSSIGQVGTGGLHGSLNMNSGDFLLINLKNVYNADAFNPDIYANVEGSPYLSPDWLYARIKLEDNNIYDSVLVKVNFFESKIHFKDDNGKEKMVAIPVKELEIIDIRSLLYKSVFVSGYGEDKNEFYQAITDGKKAGLLKKMKIVIREHKVYNAPPQKKFETDAIYYIYANKSLYEQAKNCSSLSDAFKNDAKVIKFISSNDVKCNKEKDLKKLVEYYNSY